nr:hypothetical protein BaRGS_024620 [Batillaria attramentaria]
MFVSEKAPEWKDGETCTRCRVQFGMMQRKVPPQRSEQEIAEEEELQLALALSRSEAENKEKERERLRQNYGVYGGGSNNRSSPAQNETPQPAVIPSIDTSDMDPELARYLNRNYWQKRSEETKTVTTTPSAPAASNTAPQMSSGKMSEVTAIGSCVDQPLQNGEQSESDKAQFLAALQSSLEIFVNRMRSNSQRGRPIANDSSVQSLFAVISNMHPQLLKYQQELEDSRGYYEGLQDKLTQLRDAREALDSLREEHREKRRREMEEMERQRQIQMMQKLEVMRQKKHEYLEMQRQLALQRLQEQEREMAMRLEQQKQLTHMRQMQAYGYPQMAPQMYGQVGPPSMMGGMMPPQGMPPSMGPQGPQSMVHGYSPARSTEGSPVHQLSGYGQPMPPQQNVGPVMEGPQMSQGVYMPPGVNQPAYSQAGTMGHGAGQTYTSQVSNIPSGYQPQGQPGHQPGMEGGQVPVTTFASMGYHDQGMVSMGQQSMPGVPVSLSTQPYTSMPPPSMDYSSFNMQSMASALPQQTQAGMYTSQQMGQQPPPPQQYMGPGGMPGQYQNPQMGPAPQGQQMPPMQQQQQQQPQHQPPPMQQQQQQPPPQQHQQLQQPPESLLDAQLISFD